MELSSPVNTMCKRFGKTGGVLPYFSEEWHPFAFYDKVNL
jgi:hypothetical protein